VISAFGTKLRCDASTGRSGAEHKAAMRGTHHLGLNHTQSLDNFRLSSGQKDFAAPKGPTTEVISFAKFAFGRE
jgi:hypothetical protein